MNSQTGEVSLSILDPVVLSSVSIVPFDTEPHAIGSVHFPYVSDGPDVTRERETSVNGRCDTDSRLDRDTRRRH